MTAKLNIKNILTHLSLVRPRLNLRKIYASLCKQSKNLIKYPCPVHTIKHNKSPVISCLFAIFLPKHTKQSHILPIVLHTFLYNILLIYLRSNPRHNRALERLLHKRSRRRITRSMHNLSTGKIPSKIFPALRMRLRMNIKPPDIFLRMTDKIMHHIQKHNPLDLQIKLKKRIKTLPDTAGHRILKRHNRPVRPARRQRIKHIIDSILKQKLRIFTIGKPGLMTESPCRPKYTYFHAITIFLRTSKKSGYVLETHPSSLITTPETRNPATAKLIAIL